jgi:hypothetical protein
MTDVLFDKQTLTLKQLTSAMRKMKKHAKYGLYLVVEDVTGSTFHPRPMFSVELWGPKLKWKRKIKIEMELESAI